MRMTIIDHWPQQTRLDGSVAPAYDHDPCVFEESGWTSVKEMQKELLSRFPKDGPVKIENGIRYTTLSFGRQMSVMLSD